MAYSYNTSEYSQRIRLAPTDKYLEKCFKMFKRFLKDNGVYSFIFSHIFPDGRPKEDFLKHTKRLYIEYSLDFGHVLHMSGTLGDYYRKKHINNSISYWEKNICHISKMWETYFKEHKHEIKDK